MNGFPPQRSLRSLPPFPGTLGDDIGETRWAWSLRRQRMMFQRRKRSPDFGHIDIHPSFLPSKKGRPRNPSAFPRASGRPGLPGARWGKPSIRVFPKSAPRRRERTSRGGPSNPIWGEGRSLMQTRSGSDRMELFDGQASPVLDIPPDVPLCLSAAAG